MGDDRTGSASSKPVGVAGSEALDPNSFGKFLGLASWLMSMSKAHRDLPISTLDERILPAILLKQFKLIKKETMPVAFLSWAMVSDEVKERMSKPDARIDLTEWRSGDNLILVECISPFAPAEKIKKDFLERMQKAA
ncbi:toxin-activating lysine-acyltransferase [Parasulfitobacter algicola]|uniref:RTX toxin-activating lysine-acyltransferase n=1 Tax=Parasulfitobacter algicola TaxID=2614809 RepID=A0ABX2J1L6_9RHOB|nr:toxin-activating lysine-acyltransferase [Sulfitobacter algicola]NSX56903.1 toxin-activating lysine-acyltransferase [Sulfitobacter algicola]